MNATAVCVSLILSGLVLAADHSEIPLWTNGAPGSEGKTAKEVDEPPNKDHGYFKVTSVHNPSITVFLPPRETATGAAMVIAPGGGHQFLNFDQEGTHIAAYLNSIGVAGFVLKYRSAREPGSTYKIEEHALATVLVVSHKRIRPS
jgi:acetyl esterase/lipase